MEYLMGASIRQALGYHFQPGLIFMGKARPLLEKAVGIENSIRPTL
jgi:hypothetical protein